MPHISISLKAGKPTRQTVGLARFLTVQSLGGAAGVDVDIEVSGLARETVPNVRERDHIAVGEPGFEALTFTAPVDCTIDVIASLIDVRLNNAEGAGVQATIVGPLPLSVVTSRGNAPANPFFVTGITYSDTPAASIVDRAAVAVTDAGAVVLPADATRLQALIANIGDDSVALGAPGITWAKRANVLYPGDSVIVDSKGAALAWSAITDAGTTASVTVQEFKA